MSEAAAAPRVISELLPKELTPEEVSQWYFKACRDRDPDLWLATLHVDRRKEATSAKPGPFDTMNWDLGRARCQKYQVEYAIVSNSAQFAKSADSDVVLMCEPRYGKVPGYKQGERLGAPVEVVLRKEEGEWRVVLGSF